MYENDPRMLFNQPLSALIGIMSSIVLLTQLFASFFLTTVYIYIFEVIIYICMLLVLSSGVRQKKVGNILAYSFFLIIYVFWTSFGVMIFIWYISLEAGLPCRQTSTPTPVKTLLEVNTVPPTGLPGLCGNHMGGQYVALLVCCIAFSSISLLACAYQIRLCFLLQKILKSEHRNRNMAIVTYQNRFGFTAPPRYTVSSPAPPPPSTLATATNLPEKPPCYAEALSSPTQPAPAIQLQPEVLMQDLNRADEQQAAPSRHFSDLLDLESNRSNPTANIASQEEETFETIILDPQTPVHPSTSTAEPTHSSIHSDNQPTIGNVDLLN
ncbi:unnamed protein product [Auanema sp. JU1783]|nr:unnamed protein product [Auanema sp. JU1783]